MTLFPNKKKYENEYYELKVPFKIKLKSFLTGLFFATLIVLIPVLVGINLLVFYYFLPWIVVFLTILALLWLFLVQFFMNKALNIYDERTKECHLNYIIATDFIFQAFLVILLVSVYFAFFYKV